MEGLTVPQCVCGPCMVTRTKWLYLGNCLINSKKYLHPLLRSHCHALFNKHYYVLSANEEKSISCPYKAKRQHLLTLQVSGYCLCSIVKFPSRHLPQQPVSRGCVLRRVHGLTRLRSHSTRIKYIII